MSRIRSIHPGLWTDDAFMALSAHARLLIIGIWTEAFDDGVFDWKPLTLRARIFPVDSIDMTALLEELESGGFVRRELSGDRAIGLVRNFRVYQRPKKPNSSGMLKPEWATYVGIPHDDPEPVPHQFPTGTEKSPQMEDGGGSVKEESPPRPPKGGERSGRRGGKKGASALLEQARRMQDGHEGSGQGVGSDSHDARRLPQLAIGDQ